MRNFRAAFTFVPLATALVLALSPAANAAPPPEGSEDYKIMHPYKEWVTSQHDLLGRWCCDIGDGRPVDARITGDHWEVHITKEHFPDEEDRWLAVPDEKITHGLNPMGTPILWMYQGRVQCFAPPDGV
jgi:hypothetical protein